MLKPNLDENQMYSCVRRAIIRLFADRQLEDFGYDISQFESVMKFVKECYISYAKERGKI